MAETLRMAGQKRAYTLSDRGTFLREGNALELVIVHQGDPSLQNHYSVTLVSPNKHPHVRHDAARRFVEFVLSEEGKRLISTFGVAEYGKPLFFLEQ